MASRVVIGAGLSGLTLAKELLNRGYEVKVVDLRNRRGGISIIDPESSRFLDKLIDIPVELEKTAVRVAGRVLAISRKGVEVVDQGYVATGFRVLTLVELGIVGDRPSGIYPFHAAMDLILQGLGIGRKIAVYGFNRYSIHLAERLAEEARSVTLITPIKQNARIPSDIGIIVGRVRRVIGSSRVEAILVDNERIEVDTLVIAAFRPWNPFPDLDAVGHAAIEVYDPAALMETSRLMAENMECEDPPVRVKIKGNVKIFPPRPRKCLKRILIAGTSEGRVTVNGRSIDLREGYALIDIKDLEEVIIRS